MAKLTFKMDEVKKIVAHSKGREHGTEHYGEKLDPKRFKEFLYLVHDQGVYLMSGAKERQPNPDGKTPIYVTYAEGCNPETDGEWYDEARYLVGGDDFAIPLGLDIFETAIRLYEQAGQDKIAINLGAKTLSIVMPKTRKKRGQAPA
jgi:hypothetical protein